jgi:type IV pilus assembly protein PilV
MVAILIFALGILGLVAMGGAAVSSQSDAQYRTEASSLADAIAGEIAIGINRSTEVTKAATLLRSRISPPRADAVPAPCAFGGAAINPAAAPGVARC